MSSSGIKNNKYINKITETNTEKKTKEEETEQKKTDRY